MRNIGNGIKPGGIAGILIVLIIGLVLVGLASIWQTKIVNSGWEPAMAHTAFIDEVTVEEKAADAAAKAKRTVAKEARKISKQTKPRK